MFQQQVKFEPMSVDIHPGGTTVAVGGSVSTVLCKKFQYIILYL